jgi:hypothetical protein
VTFADEGFAELSAALATSAAMNALLAIEMLIGNCEET